MLGYAGSATSRRVQSSLSCAPAIQALGSRETEHTHCAPCPRSKALAQELSLRMSEVAEAVKAAEAEEAAAGDDATGAAGPGQGRLLTLQFFSLPG